MIAHLILFAIAAAGFAIACRFNFLRGFIIVQLCIIAFTGVHATVFGPITLNAGAALYAAVTPALIVIYLRHGRAHVWKAVKVAAFADVLLIALSATIHNLEPAAPSPMANAIVRVTNWPAEVGTASILAFVAASATVIGMMRYRHVWPLWLTVMVAIAMAQLVDSLIFFPVALARLPWPVVAEIILYGWLLKSVAGIALMPVVLLMANPTMKRKRQ